MTDGYKVKHSQNSSESRTRRVMSCERCTVNMTVNFNIASCEQANGRKKSWQSNNGIKTQMRNSLRHQWTYKPIKDQSQDLFSDRCLCIIIIHLSLSDMQREHPEAFTIQVNVEIVLDDDCVNTQNLKRSSWIISSSLFIQPLHSSCPLLFKLQERLSN